MSVISPSAFAPPIVTNLREKIRRLERAHSLQPAGKTAVPLGLPAIDALLPDGGLLTGALHEIEDHRASGGLFRSPGQTARGRIRLEDAGSSGHLFHSLSGNLQLPVRGLVGLLDEPCSTTIRLPTAAQ